MGSHLHQNKVHDLLDQPHVGLWDWTAFIICMTRAGDRLHWTK